MAMIIEQTTIVHRDNVGAMLTTALICCEVTCCMDF